MHISIISAVAKNGVIGLDNKMPWHISGDLKYFKAKTMGKPMIMGRNTFESMGKLPGRTSIIISRNPQYKADEGVIVVTSIAEAIAFATEIAMRDEQDEIMIVGGGQIYALGLPHADRIYLTEVDIEPKGDAYFPTFDASEWVEMSRKTVLAGAGDESDYAFVVLDRR
ncbi:MAG: dihydrofolate reductase [Rhizobiales bacterium]|nr:dihydrofolate reductase [Hyphomicrobiales bacterium]NRB13950.1 dihydrofolate reductase [Hyphomicrobiales bacterium]